MSRRTSNELERSDRISQLKQRENLCGFGFGPTAEMRESLTLILACATFHFATLYFSYELVQYQHGRRRICGIMYMQFLKNCLGVKLLRDCRHIKSETKFIWHLTTFLQQLPSFMLALRLL